MNPLGKVLAAAETTDKRSGQAGRRRSAFHRSLFTFHLSPVRRAFSSLRAGLSLATAAFFLGSLSIGRADDAIPPKIPLQDFFRNPKAAGYNLSDDGKFLAFLAPWQNRLNVWVQSATGGEPTRRAGVTGTDLGYECWTGSVMFLFQT